MRNHGEQRLARSSLFSERDLLKSQFGVITGVAIRDNEGKDDDDQARSQQRRNRQRSFPDELISRDFGVGRKRLLTVGHLKPGFGGGGRGLSVDPNRTFHRNPLMRPLLHAG